MRLVRTTEGFAKLPSFSPKPHLDPKLATRLTDFVAFLQEVEDHAALLRRDQLEQVIESAIKSFGFESLGKASSAMEWLFARPSEFS